MLSALYAIIIEPLVLVVELIFSFLYRVIGDAGPAIIGVSVAVSFLVLPLYAMADAIQQDERDKQAAMAFWVDHIKAHFKGDEQYMILTTYYRQQGYSQLSSLRSSFSLLLQIPFFIAAYRYLSGVEALNGVPFWFIRNLAQPDALFTVGGFTVNVLPIAMTLLNIASSAVYTRGLPFKDKIQTYALALVFLVLLYDSPAGLVLYWTCNQIFSLVKNILLKLFPNPGRDGALLVIAGVVGIGAWLVLSGRLGSPRRQLVFGALAVVTVALALRSLLAREEPAAVGKHAKGTGKAATKPDSLVFLFAALCMTVLMGLVIPTALFGANPAEFIDIYDFVNPLDNVVHTLLVCLGLFVLWGGVYFYLSDAAGRRLVITVYLVIVGAALVNYFAGRELGIITSGLLFEDLPMPTRQQSLVNLGLGATAIVALLVAHHFKPTLVRTALGVLAGALVATSVPNIMTISQVAAAQEQAAIDVRTATTDYADPMFDEEGNILPIAQVSTGGRNVVVLFLDRGLTGFLPYILNERPELAESLEGFTYYPNTLAYGGHTLFSAPALYGGYEYSLAGMKTRPDMTVDEKTNEALQVLPAILEDEGFNITMTDVPRLDWTDNDPNYTMYDGYENVHAYRTVGAYKNYLGNYTEVLHENFQRNLFFYSVLKVAPAALQHIIYDDGVYYSTLVNHAASNVFLNNYSVLTNLGNIVEVVDDSSDNLFFLHNDTTHSPELLQLPDYEPALFLHNDDLEDYSRFTVNGVSLDMTDERSIPHYHINMASLIQVCAWLDELRASGAWDNTRIIIVSDHGYDLRNFPNLIYNPGLDVERLNALLLVKDFGATGPLTTNDEFMTVSDVPVLVMDGIVDNPTNPFTGNPITMDGKQEPQLVTTSRHNMAKDHEGLSEFDTSDQRVYAVSGDVFDPNCWQALD